MKSHSMLMYVAIQMPCRVVAVNDEQYTKQGIKGMQTLPCFIINYSRAKSQIVK